MLKTTVTLVAAALAVCTCSGSSSGQGPTAASVAVQPGDLPSGMVKCDLTGDMDSFIKAESGPDPATSKTMATRWQDAKSKGAQAGYTAVYTDSAEHCSGIKTSGSDIGAATYRLVLNFVVQYKDETSAAAGYKGDSNVGFRPSDLKSGTAPFVEGTKTGLTSNSVTLTQPFDKQLFYLAVWQNKSFVVSLAILNLDAASAKGVAVSENSRIK